MGVEMDQKLFSIITPTYNSGGKLPQTIASVLAQDRDLFEYIVVDGGSTDDTESVLRSHGRSLKYISEKDEGVYDAMNKGIEMSRGKYLYFLGAGDRLRENVLREISGEMPRARLFFVYGNVYMVDRGAVYGGEFGKRQLRENNICHQAIFYERDIFDLLGKYEHKYKVLADYVFNLKCFSHKEVKMKFIDHVIADFEGDGMSATERDPHFISDRSRLIRSHLGVSQYLMFERDKRPPLRPFKYLEEGFRYRWRVGLRSYLRGKLG